MKTHIDLSDKTIFITGGLGGIAEYMIKAFLDSGATLVVTSRSDEAKAVQQLRDFGITDQSRLTYFPLDVTDAKAMHHVVTKSFEKHPDINVVIGHAGGTGVFPFGECSQEKFDDLVKFNFLSQTYLAREVMAQWVARKTEGHLIYTSSYVSKIPMEGISAYTASKAALEMFARNLALEYAKHQIRVNIMNPGNVAVGSSKLVYDNDPVYKAWVDRVSPLGKRNSPEAMANTFLYMCSHLADEMDGQVVQVDAGVGLPKLG